MRIKQIEAIGNLLTYYRTDLNYINQFQKFKKGEISSDDYLKKESGSFYSFLIEYRVIRNIPIGTVDKILIETQSWISTEKSDDVDSFAKNLKTKGLTRGKTMTSLASKILFLNNPWEIIPMDKLARKALRQTENNYSAYLNNINEFKQKKGLELESMGNYTNPLTNLINNEFNELGNLNLICENRITDKLLWTLGK